MLHKFLQIIKILKGSKSTKEKKNIIADNMDCHRALLFYVTKSNSPSIKINNPSIEEEKEYQDISLIKVEEWSNNLKSIKGNKSKEIKKNLIIEFCKKYVNPEDYELWIKICTFDTPLGMSKTILTKMEQTPTTFIFMGCVQGDLYAKNLF